ncbi:hypothetical protein T492DRAFT_198851 [Pavlovales sp. CCMP2436]|nr:hypothetical protein T492DRAFT_198851 [Pavlovales sp. CCMP2436]
MLREDSQARQAFRDELQETERVRKAAKTQATLQANIHSAWLTPSPSQLAPMRAQQLEAAHTAVAERLSELRLFEEEARLRTIARAKRLQQQQADRATQATRAPAVRAWLTVVAVAAWTSRLRTALVQARRRKLRLRLQRRLSDAAQQALGAQAAGLLIGRSLYLAQKYVARFRYRVGLMRRRRAAPVLREFLWAARKSPLAAVVLTRLRKAVIRLQRWWRGVLLVLQARVDVLMMQLLALERQMHRGLSSAAMRGGGRAAPTAPAGQGTGARAHPTPGPLVGAQSLRLGQRIAGLGINNAAEGARLTWCRKTLRRVTVKHRTREAIVRAEVQRRVRTHHFHLQLFRAQLEACELVRREQGAGPRLRSQRGIARPEHAQRSNLAIPYLARRSSRGPRRCGWVRPTRPTAIGSQHARRRREAGQRRRRWRSAHAGSGGGAARLWRSARAGRGGGSSAARLARATTGAATAGGSRPRRGVWHRC